MENGLGIDRQKSSLEASSRVSEKGANYKNSKTGNTLLHDAADTTQTAICVIATSGLNINAQNFDGDTALHLAMRAGNMDTSRALLRCGTDLNLRNKLGQSALDEATGKMKDLLSQFKPGLVSAVTKAEPFALQRLTRLWCNPHTKIKDGKSALELLSPRKQSEEGACRCYNYLKEHLHTLELVHAVLADDSKTLKSTLETKKGWNANVRFRDKRGMTPLSCAVDQNNLEMTRLLVETGKSSINIRVRETENEPHTVPLYFKSLDASCSEQLWAYLGQHVDDRQDLERDPDGNTAIFRAMVNGKNADFITALLHHKKGLNITDRNMVGETPREAAVRVNRDDVVKVIDEYLVTNSDRGFLINLPLNFYGKHQMQATSSQGKTLKEIAAEGKNEIDIQATASYRTIEKQGVKLFECSIAGKVKEVAKYNTAIYRDKTGLTALTKAIVHNQPAVAEMLITEKPQLRLVPDNKNRYPLHYSYILPEAEGHVFQKIVLRQNPEEVEHRTDKDGRTAAEFGLLRGLPEGEEILREARAVDAASLKTTSTLTTPAPSILSTTPTET